jgi:hypothetical protein
MQQELDEGKSSYQGRSLKLRVSITEKSAEAIVLCGNEPTERIIKGWRTHKQGKG